MERPHDDGAGDHLNPQACGSGPKADLRSVWQESKADDRPGRSNCPLLAHTGDPDRMRGFLK